MIDVRITGLDQMQRGLRRVRRSLVKDVDRAIRRAVSEPGLRRHAPIDTGALRRSVRSRRITFGQYRVTIGNRKVFYGHMVKLRGIRRTRRQWQGLVLLRARRELGRVRVRR